jgi:hypothetical protein
LRALPDARGTQRLLSETHLRRLSLESAGRDPAVTHPKDIEPSSRRLPHRICHLSSVRNGRLFIGFIYGKNREIYLSVLMLIG